MEKVSSTFVTVSLCLVLSLALVGQQPTPSPTPNNAVIPVPSPTPSGTPGDSTRVTVVQPNPTPSVSPTPGASPTPADPMGPQVFSGMRFRSIGPAVTGGRVIAFAVDPTDRAKYYVAVASGGVWKTVNSGTTFTPVFDGDGAYSIGAIAMDP